MLIAGVAVYFMPQSPGSWKYLTPRQQYIAGERIQREHDAVRDLQQIFWSYKRAYRLT